MEAIAHARVDLIGDGCNLTIAIIIARSRSVEHAMGNNPASFDLKLHDLVAVFCFSSVAVMHGIMGLGLGEILFSRQGCLICEIIGADGLHEVLEVFAAMQPGAVALGIVAVIAGDVGECGGEFGAAQA